MKKCLGNEGSYESVKMAFKGISRDLTKSIRKDKKKYFNNKLDQCQTLKEYWAELKKICGMKVSKNPIEIKIKDETNNNVISDEKEVAQLLNEHYAAIAQKELGKNPLFQNKVNINYTLETEKTALHSFGCHEITMYDLYKAVKKLKNKNSRGEHGITSHEIK